jgi:hypothetical protein
MIKLAIFCEGLTEQCFCEQFVRVKLDRKGVGQVHAWRRGVAGKRSIVHISATEHKIQVIDCGGGGNRERVIADIRQAYVRLAEEGFSCIIGVRDVYPNDRQDLACMKSYGTKFAIPQDDVVVHPPAVALVYAVMEVEAWFLAEYSHFGRIDEQLTVDLVCNRLCFDPRGNMEDRERPAGDLHAVYQLVGKAYKKEKRQIRRTVNALDMDRMIDDLTRSYTPLEELNRAVDACFA